MVSSSECKPHKEDKTPIKDVFPDGSKTVTLAAPKKWTVFRRTTAVFAVILLLSGVILTAAFLTRKKQTSGRLVEVNLEQGETLTYHVEQNLEVQGGELQKGKISTIVALQVKNKTSEEYWFILKVINITVKGENLDKIGDVQPGITNYFLVKLERTSRSGFIETPHSNNKTDESFEIYGHRKTDEEFTRYVHALLDQLLPTVKRDLYELVDGEKPNVDAEPRPEKSPIFPGSVKMHREANTSEPNGAILIKNSFNRSDITNVSSDIDLDMKYSDATVINKSNGMVTEGQARLTEQLNFGEPIQSKNGTAVTMMNVTFASYVTLLEVTSNRRSFLEDEELEDVNIHAFVKLALPKSDIKFTVKKQSDQGAPNERSNSSDTFTDHPEDPEANTTGTPLSGQRRTRRGITSDLAKKLDGAIQKFLDSPVKKTLTIFEKKVIGINVKGEITVWVDKIRNFYKPKSYKIELDLVLRFGASLRVKLLGESIPSSKIKSGSSSKKTLYGWEIVFDVGIPVYFLRLGVEFKLWNEANIAVNFPSGLNSFSPLQLAVEVSPTVALKASISGYVSVWVLRAGVYGSGNLIRGSLPATLSYNENRLPNKKTCLSVAVDCGFLELQAGIFYQWKSCTWSWFRLRCRWGTRRTLVSFGSWAALRYNRQLSEECI